MDLCRRASAPGGTGVRRRYRQSVSDLLCFLSADLNVLKACAKFSPCFSHHTVNSVKTSSPASAASAATPWRIPVTPTRPLASTPPICGRNRASRGKSGRANLALLNPEMDGELLVSLHIDNGLKTHSMSKIRVSDKIAATKLGTRRAGNETSFDLRPSTFDLRPFISPPSASGSTR